MYNHFNFKACFDEILVTNDLGRYAFLTQDQFRMLLNGRIKDDAEKYLELKEKQFVYDEPFEIMAQKYAGGLRSIKRYLFSSTALHIFAVTNACNLNCVYCQAKDIDSKLSGFMTVETGRKAIELAMQSPNNDLTFEFQGGEPLLNFNVIMEMIKYSKELNADTQKNIQYTIVTNLIAMTDDQIERLQVANVSICTSLDGCEVVHNQNRPLKSNGAGSYWNVIHQIEKLHSLGITIGAIETTTRCSLDYPKELIDTYLALDINSIFIRAMTPLGFAKAYWDKIGYSAEEYLRFYRSAFEYILQINQAGHFFPELQAVYFLRKMLVGNADNYMELRSPCGAGVGQLSYYYDGNVYTCDKDRMISESGDNAFMLGNVFTSSYSDLMESQTCKSLCAASVVESLPHCCDCAYHPYCGVCPAVIYANDHNIFSGQPFEFRCKIHSGILDLLFEKIHENDPSIIAVFERWIEEI